MVRTIHLIRRPWSKREEEKLEDLITRYPVDIVARKHKRTETAILVKLKRLKISKNRRNEWYTQEEASDILGMAAKSLNNRITEGLLLAVPHDPKHPPRKGHSAPWHIKRQDLVKYIINYTPDLVGRKVDILQIVELLVNR